MNWVSGTGHETDFPSEQEKTVARGAGLHKRDLTPSRQENPPRVAKDMAKIAHFDVAKPWKGAALAARLRS